MAESTTTHALPDHPRQWHAHIWRLTWPVILANITIPMVGVADVWVMGRMPDAAYIASVALGASMFSAVYWLFGFIRMGTTGLVAQRFGRRQLEDIVGVFARAGIIALALGCLMVLLQGPLAWLLFNVIFQPAGDVAEFASTYYHIRVFGAPALLLNLAQLGVLFGLQRMRDTLILSVGLNMMNLILDLVLVLGLDMGVAGVATGTVISEWSAAFLGMWLVRRALQRAGASFTLPSDLWDLKHVAPLFHISSNLILRTFFVQLPFLGGTIVATGMGETVLAAHGVLMQLFFVMTYSLDGFAHTAETLTGYCFGAGKPRDLRRATLYAAWWALVLAACTSALYLFAGEAFIFWFTQAADVRAFAPEFIPWLALAPVLCTWAFLFDGIFIGTTHIVEMRNAMMLAALGWLVTLLLTMDRLDYHAVWIAMSVFMLIRSALLALYYPRVERHAAAESAVAL